MLDNPKDRRDCPVSANFTEEEFEDIRREALRLGMKPTRYVRIATLRTLNPKLAEKVPFAYGKA